MKTIFNMLEAFGMLSLIILCKKEKDNIVDY